MKAHAVVFTDRCQVSFLEVEAPEPGEDDVVIDVEYSWISNGTESSFLRGERIAGDRALRPDDPWPFPQVAGYQKVGVVTQIGSRIQNFKVGDRVFATISHVDHMFFPYGGHISPAVTHVSQVYKLPDQADPIRYSGAVLTQVGYNCGTRPPLECGEEAVVIGDGMVGQWAAQTLLHRGANVTVLGRHDERLCLLPKEIRGINVSNKEAAEPFAGRRISVLVDTVGSMNTLQELMPLLNRNGHLVSAGFYGTSGMIDIQALRDQEITLHCPAGWDRGRMERTLEGIAEGWLETERLITHRLPAHRVSEAWEWILQKKHGVLGIVFMWQ